MLGMKDATYINICFNNNNPEFANVCWVFTTYGGKYVPKYFQVFYIYPHSSLCYR